MKKAKDNINHPIIDVSVHLGISAYGEEQGTKKLLKSMNQDGIGTSIVSCFTPPDLSFYKGNRLIEQAVRQNPSRLKGAVRIDPRAQESRKTLRKFLGKKSFVCVSLNPFEQAFKVNSPLVNPIYETAERTNVPVMLESGYPIVSLAFQVAEVAKEFRKVKFVMTHAGQLLASGQSEADSLRVMLDNPNIYCDTSQIILSGIGGFIERVMHEDKKYSRTRVMFGSNSPHGELSMELMRVTKADITDDEKRLVLSKNAEKLFEL
jgi:uncharacterized protein